MHMLCFKDLINYLKETLALRIYYWCYYYYGLLLLCAQDSDILAVTIAQGILDILTCSGFKFVICCD
jgi:uncharacterized membrane protein